MHRLALLAREGKDRMASELGQTAAQLRLKNHDQRYREENRETAKEPADHDQIQQRREDRKSTRLISSHSQISYAVFCLKKKKKTQAPVTVGDDNDHTRSKEIDIHVLA